MTQATSPATDPIPRLPPGHDAAGSGGIVADNVTALQALFPAIVADGRVDFAVLRQLLGDAVDDADERYGLNWHGKRAARAFALTPGMATLRPAPADSVEWNTTRNIVIEGDNLEVLKLLRRSYAGQVKLIYIDPPYNTGNDFVYPDDYRDSLARYELLTGQRDAADRVTTTDREASGRFHTDWLTMIYPRLLVAKELLADDGAIVIQCDENEVSNINALMEEIFGREGRLNMVVVKMSHLSGMKMAHVDRKFAKIKEFLLIWTPSTTLRMNPVYEPCSWDEAFPRYNRWITNIDDAPDRWIVDSVGNQLAAAGVAPAARDAFLVANAHRIFRTAVNDAMADLPRDGRFRTVTTTTGLERLACNGEEVVFASRKIRTINGRPTPATIIGDLWSDIGINNLHKEGGVDFPNGKKPVKLIQRLVAAFTGPADTVLDFFAGSGTTGHAVMLCNAEDGGTRRHILVQLPEPVGDRPEQRAAAALLDAAGRPRTIAELTKERLRRSRAEISRSFPDATPDTGFRVYTLAASNLKPWDPHPHDLVAAVTAAVDNILPGRSEDDLLVELLLRTGIDLTTPADRRVIAGATVHALGGGGLIVCLGAIGANAAALGDGIADWHAELSPPRATRFYFRDSGFASAAAKANLAAILRQRVGTANIALLASL